jgi:hypothetical protein
MAAADGQFTQIRLHHSHLIEDKQLATLVEI